MSYIIDNIAFDLSNPINKYWYSKFKKDLMKNRVYYIKKVLEDAKNKRKVEYTPKYYACVKFIKHTTNLRFTKHHIIQYYIGTIAEDFYDVVKVYDKNKLSCNYDTHIIDGKARWNYGREIGKCKNKCCTFYKQNKSFYIEWK